jgi:hypothetical protein
MNLKNILTERDFVVIDPRGNARPVGMKMQGAQYVKKMGGPKRGYHLVLAKNAMKARRAIEKNGGNATNSKIQKIMFDLMYETVAEANQYKDVSNKFKNALDVMPEKYFNRKGIIALIKKLKEKRPDAAMAYAMDAFGWMPGMKESIATDHDGKAAPYGSGYEKVDESTKLKDVIKEFQYFGLSDDTMLQYKDKDGKMQIMKAGSAKKLPDEHPAKIAYNKEREISDKFMKDKQDNPSYSKAAKHQKDNPSVSFTRKDDE